MLRIWWRLIGLESQLRFLVVRTFQAHQIATQLTGWGLTKQTEIFSYRLPIQRKKTSMKNKEVLILRLAHLPQIEHLESQLAS